MSIDSADYQMKTFVSELFLQKNMSKEHAMKRIVKFFTAYDASRDMTILVLQKQVEMFKKSN